MGYAFKVCVPKVDNKGGSKIAPYSYPPNVKCEGQNQQRGRLKCTVTILSRSGTFMVACLPVVLLSPAAHTLNIQFFMGRRGRERGFSAAARSAQEMVKIEGFKEESLTSPCTHETA